MRLLTEILRTNSAVVALGTEKPPSQTLRKLSFSVILLLSFLRHSEAIRSCVALFRIFPLDVPPVSPAVEASSTAASSRETKRVAGADTEQARTCANAASVRISCEIPCHVPPPEGVVITRARGINLTKVHAFSTCVTFVILSPLCQMHVYACIFPSGIFLILTSHKTLRAKSTLFYIYLRHTIMRDTEHLHISFLLFGLL